MKKFKFQLTQKEWVALKDYIFGVLQEDAPAPLYLMAQSLMLEVYSTMAKKMFLDPKKNTFTLTVPQACAFVLTFARVPIDGRLGSNVILQIKNSLQPKLNQAKNVESFQFT